MNEINIFQELMRNTLEMAKNKNHSIDVREIGVIFKDMDLNSTQLYQIKDYLTANQIDVTGSFPSGPVTENTGADNEPPQNGKPGYDRQENDEPGNDYETKASSVGVGDSVYLKQYKEELEAIRPGTKEEELLLISRIRQGDGLARERFIELNLKRVIDIAYEYVNQGMTAGDLIQEGNVALVRALDELPEAPVESGDDISGFISDFIRKEVREALKAQREQDAFEDIMIEKSDRIFKALKELEDELGKKADIHELAQFMKLPEEEIMDTLNLSGDAIKLEHDHDE